MRAEDGVEMGQALILLGDILLQGRFRTEERTWRAEEQEWRSEDREWRQQDIEWRAVEKEFMSAQKAWRLRDLEQRSLDNVRVLWSRFVDKNRHEVEERAEQLKSLGNSSAIIAGFAVVAFLEFQADWSASRAEGGPGPLLTAIFGLSTALVVGLNAQVMITSSLMHASILKSSKAYITEPAEAEFVQSCLSFATHYRLGDQPPAPARTFAQHWNTRCEPDWRWVFVIFCGGLVAFTCNLIIAAWIKFPGPTTPSIITASLAVCLIGMARSMVSWAPHLFHSEAKEAAAQTAQMLQQDEAYGLPFDWHRTPVPYSADRSAAKVRSTGAFSANGAAGEDTQDFASVSSAPTPVFSAHLAADMESSAPECAMLSMTNSCCEIVTNPLADGHDDARMDQNGSGREQRLLSAEDIV